MIADKLSYERRIPLGSPYRPASAAITVQPLVCCCLDPLAERLDRCLTGQLIDGLNVPLDQVHVWLEELSQLSRRRSRPTGNRPRHQPRCTSRGDAPGGGLRRRAGRPLCLFVALVRRWLLGDLSAGKKCWCRILGGSPDVAAFGMSRRTGLTPHRPRTGPMSRAAAHRLPTADQSGARKHPPHQTTWTGGSVRGSRSSLARRRRLGPGPAHGFVRWLEG
jgi:hypothetical protein